MEPLCKLPTRELRSDCCLETYPKIDLKHSLDIPKRCKTYLKSEDIYKQKSEMNYSSYFKRLQEKLLATVPVFDFLLYCTQLYLKIKNSFKLKLLPHKLGLEDTTVYVETRDWSTAAVRSMAWHPQYFIFAIAGEDDIISTYSEDGLEKSLIMHKQQNSITCLAWRPYVPNELAVGCDLGIAFWFSDNPNSMGFNFKLLQQPNHAPVTSIAWSDCGLLLASASIGDASILIWNTDNSKYTPLRRVGAEVFLIKLAPTTSNLLCATIKGNFSILYMKKMCRKECWSLGPNRIQSACWSPCGQILLFIISNDAKMYCFQQIRSSLFENDAKDWLAFPIADLTSTAFDACIIGGLPQLVVWDPRGTFVAVSFKISKYVAIFRVSNMTEKLRVIPECFICKEAEVYPLLICFQSCNTDNADTVLTIAWSSGNVQFYSLKNV